MAITRRQFIKRTGLLTAGTVLGPNLFANPLVRQALAFQNKYFIVLFLDGGNDGLNTVVPYDGTLRTWYTDHRSTGSGGLQLSQGSLGSTLLTKPTLASGGKDPNTTNQLALHPGFRDSPGNGLNGLWEI